MGRLRTGEAPTADEDDPAEIAVDTAVIRRQAEALRGLPRLAAPAALDERLAVFFGGVRADSEAPGLSLTRSWQVLEIHPAPSVLERLLAEELDDPQAYMAQRFIGSLEAVEVPDELSERVERALRRRFPRRLAASLGALAAAGFLAWVLVDSSAPPHGPGRVSDRSAESPSPNVPRRHLEVRIASLRDSTAEISPLVLGLVEALNHGVLTRASRGGG